MPLSLRADPVPIQMDEYGVARVGGTRVTLETVIIAFSLGATAEEILQRYPALSLADIYAVISYYLHNREEVDAYVEQAEREEEAFRKENEASFDLVGIRERLLARAKSRT
jgi:uncharacterized protein (DUF433 family)